MIIAGNEYKYLDPQHNIVVQNPFCICSV